jgi:hypothetical protein
MPIIRAPRLERNFYVLDKEISEDKRLSWAARGLLVFLLGKPDHWKVSVPALINETAAATKSTGRDAVYGLLAELISVGYARRDKHSSGNVDYVVCEPIPEKPEVGKKPVPENPDTEKPDPEKPDVLVSTDKAVSIEKAVSVENSASSKSAPSNKESVWKPLDALIAAGVDKKTATDWLKLRQAKKAPVTETVLEMFTAESSKAAMSLNDALRICCSRGWAGFKAEWITDLVTAGTAGTSRPNRQEALEQQNQAVAARLARGTA